MKTNIELFNYITQITFSLFYYDCIFICLFYILHFETSIIKILTSALNLKHKIVTDLTFYYLPNNRLISFHIYIEVVNVDILID